MTPAFRENVCIYNYMSGLQPVQIFCTKKKILKPLLRGIDMHEFKTDEN
jgi:hypothetical protein